MIRRQQQSLIYQSGGLFDKSRSNRFGLQKPAKKLLIPVKTSKNFFQSKQKPQWVATHHNKTKKKPHSSSDNTSYDARVNGLFGIRPAPVIVFRSHMIPTVERESYAITAKADGLRRIILFDTNTRNTNIRIVIFSNSMQKLDEFTINNNINHIFSGRSLIDCEKIGDTFFAFDAIIINGNDIRNNSFIKRYQLL